MPAVPEPAVVPPAVGRRGLVMGAVAVPAAVSAAGRADAAGPRLRAVGMAMHVHASFSEGMASMQAQLQQATDLGVDVVWWTDHDFRLSATGYRDAVRFDGLDEPEDGTPWRWVEVREGEPVSGATTFVEALAPDETGSAMRVAVTSGSAPGASAALLREGEAWNTTYTRTLAATVLTIDVLVEPVAAGAPGAGIEGGVEGVVRVVSSYRPATGGRPAGTYVVEYRVGDDGGLRLEDDGLTGVVGLPSVAGERQRLALDLEGDVARLWPDLVSADAGLFRLQVGARSRDGAAAAVRFDRLRFERGRTGVREPLALQREVMAAYAAEFPGVVQHQGSEISLVRHLNAYGGDLTLPDYGDVGQPLKDTSERATRRMVREMQSHGSLVALNHPLGDAGGEAGLADLLVRTRALGADAVEVGTGPGATESALRAFDAAARNVVLVTATGTNDDHHGVDWRADDQRWVTSVWAGSTSEPHLLDALRAGRAFVWDPVRWSGTLGLEVSAGGLLAATGSVAVVGARRARVAVTAPDLPEGVSLVLVVGPADPTGRDGARAGTSRRPLTVVGGVAEVEVRTPGSRYLRVEARTGAGDLVAFTNPVWVLRERRVGGVPRARRARPARAGQR